VLRGHLDRKKNVASTEGNVTTYKKQTSPFTKYSYKKYYFHDWFKLRARNRWSATSTISPLFLHNKPRNTSIYGAFSGQLRFYCSFSWQVESWNFSLLEWPLMSDLLIVSYLWMATIFYYSAQNKWIWLAIAAEELTRWRYQANQVLELTRSSS